MYPYAPPTHTEPESLVKLLSFYYTKYIVLCCVMDRVNYLASLNRIHNSQVRIWFPIWNLTTVFIKDATKLQKKFNIL
jgi:hypothetical protein